MPQPSFSVVVVPDIPMVSDGDDLVEIIGRALEAADLRLTDGDVVCVAQKIVSKAEGQLVSLADITPSERAVELAHELNAEVRLHELDKLDVDVIDLEALKKAHLVSARAQKVKVILAGELSKAVTLRGVSATKGARAAIESAGGKLES